MIVSNEASNIMLKSKKNAKFGDAQENNYHGDEKFVTATVIEFGNISPFTMTSSSECDEEAKLARCTLVIIRNGACRNGACRNSACRNGDLYPLTIPSPVVSL